MSTKPGPLERAFRDETAGEVFGLACDPIQLDAFRDETGRLPTNVYQLNRATRGRGRTPGAKNKSSAEYARLHIHKYGDPRDFLGSLHSTPLDQAVEMVLAAENYQDREERLLRLCDEAANAMVTAVKEGWSGEKLKAVARMVESVERAANSMKAKPGDIGAKILAIQKDAAKEAAQYIGSKMPVAVHMSNKTDAVVIIPGINAPLDIAQQSLQDHINANGLAGIDFEQMKLIEAAPADDDEGGLADV